MNAPAIDFLIARLQDYEQSDEAGRDFFGHVVPALRRAEAAQSTPIREEASEREGLQSRHRVAAVKLIRDYFWKPDMIQLAVDIERGAVKWDRFSQAFRDFEDALQYTSLNINGDVEAG